MADIMAAMSRGKDPLTGFNFMLRVEGIYDLPCKSVRAFTRELEYDYIQEGGLNDYVHMLRKPASRPFTLEVERYVGVDYFDPLPLGADLELPVLLMVSRYPNRFIPSKAARTYTFTGCTVMKKTFGELEGDRSSLLVETTTIGYREFAKVDVPWSQDIKEVLRPAAQSLEHAPVVDRLKKDAREVLAKARAAVEAAGKDAEAVSARSEELIAAAGNARAVAALAERRLGEAYREADQARQTAEQDQAALAGQEEPSAAVRSRAQQSQKAAAAREEEAASLRALADRAPQISQELERAAAAALERLEDAGTACANAQSSLAQAEAGKKKLDLLDRLTDAQPLAGEVKELAQQSISESAKVRRILNFLTEKLEHAAGLPQADTLKRP